MAKALTLPTEKQYNAWQMQAHYSNHCASANRRSKGKRVEVIKYETKVFTEPEEKTGHKSKGAARIYIRALDNIHATMKGCRLLDRFGFNAPKKTKDKTKCTLTDDYMEWHYDLRSIDWVSEGHESTLAAYTPHPALENLLKEEMDLELE